MRSETLKIRENIESNPNPLKILPWESTSRQSGESSRVIYFQEMTRKRTHGGQKTRCQRSREIFSLHPGSQVFTGWFTIKFVID